MVAAARLLSDIFSTRDCQKLRQYIKRGYDCNARQPPRSTLLHLVARWTCTDCDIRSMAEKLLRAGAEVDAKNDDGLTPLMTCAMSANNCVAEVLIQAGADVHAVCHQGSTALHRAAANNKAALVQLLLAADASAATFCHDGLQALHYACTHGADCDVQMIKQLINSGPGLINTYSIHACSRDNVTPLLLAISGGCSTEVAIFLITSGADINATDLLGTPVLMLTSEVSMVRLLLEAGAVVNARNLFGSTILHAAAYFGRSAGIICRLLKAGADATATDTTGCTPAAVALAHGHTATAVLLQRAEKDQRSKKAQQQQQQQLAAPLSEDRQILSGWQSSIDMARRGIIASDIVAHLELPKANEWHSAHIQLLALIEHELYRRAADITAYSDGSTLQRRLNELVTDGVILQTDLKQGADVHAAQAAASTAQACTDITTAVSTAVPTVTNIQAGAQQYSHTAYDGSISSHTGTSIAVSSSNDAQLQQHQLRASIACCL
jgi:ankyrin repeat protein